MPDIKKRIQTEVACKDNSKEFLEILGEPTVRLLNFPKRIILNSKTLELKNKSKSAVTIYKAIVQSLKLEWFHSLAKTSRYSNQRILSEFVLWLENHSSKSCDEYEYLNEFQQHRIKNSMVKPQSVGLPIILNHLSAGMACGDLEQTEIKYLDILCLRTKVAEIGTRTPPTLESFFTSITWLKKFVKKSEYRKLESPKILVDSFSITVAVTLNCILKEKNVVRDSLKKSSIINNSENERITDREKEYRFAEILMFEFARVKENQSLDLLTELLIGDAVGISKSDKFLHLLNKIKLGKKLKRKELDVFNYPSIFSSHNIDKPSKLEQILFAWLCATFALPVSTIQNLSSKNFIVNRR